MRSKSRICRLCMSCKNINKEIPDKQMYIKIKECLQVEIDPDDVNLPISVCVNCVKTIRKFYAFRKKCWKVQRLLISQLRHRDFIQIVSVANINLPVFEDIAFEYERKRPCAFRPAIKKEMMIDIQEVKRPSPMYTSRAGDPVDSPRILDEKHDFTTVEIKKPCRVNESHSFEDKTTDTTPELIEQDKCAEELQTVNIGSQCNEFFGMNLNRLEPKRLESETDASNAGCAKSESLENDDLKPVALMSDVLDPETLEPKALDPDSLKQKVLDPEVSEPDAFEPEVVETEALDPEASESRALGPGDLETETLEPEIFEALESETNDPEYLTPDIGKPADINTDILDMKSHLLPHDYTTKQASGSLAESPKSRPRPRPRTTNISGKALYKSLLMACDKCGKMIERNRLEGHRNKHLGIRPYICPNESCNAAFHCKHACRLHVRCRHGNESFSCDLCDKVYRAKRDLLGHKREAHSEPKFDCDICSKKFTTRSRLKQHRFYHTGERNHPCGLCTMTFFNNFQLKVHMRIHTQARPFVCKVCKKTFRYRHMAKDHIVRQHGIDERLEKDWIIHNPEPEVSELLKMIKSNV